MKIEGDASTVGGLRELVKTLDRMDASDDAIVTGRGTRAGGRGLVLVVDFDPSAATDDGEGDG